MDFQEPTWEERFVALQQQNLAMQQEILNMRTRFEAMEQQPPPQMAVDPPPPMVVHVHDNGNEESEAKKLKSFMKMKLTKFSGSTKKEWLYDIENALEIAQITLEATKLSAIKPQNPVLVARQKLSTLVQTGSADHYLDKFSALALTADLGDQEKILSSIDGLKKDVKKGTMVEYTIGKLPTFELVARYAVALDSANYQSKTSGNSTRWKGSSSGQASGSSQASTNTSGAAPMDIDTFERYKKLDEASRAQCLREGRPEREEAVRGEDESGFSLPDEEEISTGLECDVDLVALVAVWKQASSDLLITKGRLGYAEAETLFDTGASVNLVSARFVEKHKFRTRFIPDGPIFRTADGRLHRCCSE